MTMEQDKKSWVLNIYQPTFSELNVWGFPLAMAWISENVPSISKDFRWFSEDFWKLPKMSEDDTMTLSNSEAIQKVTIIAYMYYRYTKIRAQSKGNWIEVLLLIMS